MTLVPRTWPREKLIRVHALALWCACATILCLGFQASGPSLFNWPASGDRRDESAIDEVLQQTAQTALAGREGSIVVIDVQTGRIRALVNNDQAYAQALMPGSAIKPFTALAALRAGLVNEDSRTTCPGRFTGLSFSLPCVHANHLPPFSPAQAIAHSCNYYFATLGQRIGRDNLLATLREFEFGKPTGLAANENAGILRPCENGSAARVVTSSHHAKSQADCDAREAVGESDHIQVTPIQLLMAYAALVNGGELYQPQIAAADNFFPIERRHINIAPAHRAIIVQGMAGAVRFGTARRARLDSLPLTVVGKTGTALPARGFRNNGWFVGFGGPFQSNAELPPSQAEIGILVMVARANGSEAAMIAKPIFQTYANAIAATTKSFDESEGGLPERARGRHPNNDIRVHLVSSKLTQELPLEDYVLGVMRAEGSMENEPEALKALAITIRTYALKNIGRHAKDGYDFCSTTHCQRFMGTDVTGNGGNRTNADFSAAVRSTAGQILIDERGQTIESYFGASCGGETANVGNLWGTNPPVYLRGVIDEYCTNGPHAHWIDTLSHSDLLRALNSDSRTAVGNRLEQITVGKQDATGRAEVIILEGEHHKTVRGWDFKIIVGRALGWNHLKSSRFTVSRAGSNFVFRGSGFGHGLGLCQEGAHVMAERGASYQKILQKYFPGTAIGSALRLIGTNAALPAHSAEKLRLSGIDYSFQIKGEAEPGREALNAIRRKAGGFPHYNGGQPANTPRAITLSEWKADVAPALGANRSPTSTAVPAARFLTSSSEHFRVTYPHTVGRRDADQVLNILETARADYLRRSASASISISIPTLHVRLNESTGDFTARTGQPWWAAAATRGNLIELQPFELLKRRGILQPTVRHEIAHVIIDSISRNRAPRWLAEGFALYLAGEGPAISRYVRRGLLMEEELERQMQHPRSQQEMRALYAQAYINVAEIVRTHGEASVWKRLAA